MERCLLEATFALERLPCILEAVVCWASFTVLCSLFFIPDDVQTAGGVRAARLRSGCFSCLGPGVIRRVDKMACVSSAARRLFEDATLRRLVVDDQVCLEGRNEEKKM
jgi:hypothetical protein